MRARVLIISGVALLSGLAATQAKKHFNPVVDLAIANKPIYIFYAPANQGGGRRGGAPDAAPRKTPAELAAEGVAYKGADGLFNGNMESANPERFDAAYNTFLEFAQGVAAAGAQQKTPYAHFTHPLFVKTAKIAEDTVLAAERIARQLNAGVSGVVFVGVESAKEVEQGLRMMRFKSKGGIRPDDVGHAPAIWGMTEKEYKEKADVWPLNQQGELINWTIVESKEGLAHVREIAAVKGIGALVPGAGTLGGVFRKDSAGRQVRDSVAWEGAIQQVLAACKEFKVLCGYPVGNPEVMQRRMKQGFSVFIINWGEQGFAAADSGRALAKK